MSENKINVISKVGSLLVIAMLLFSGVFLIIPSIISFTDVKAGSDWISDSDSDFINGTFNDIEVVGTGSAAELKLKKDPYCGQWINRLPTNQPQGRMDHAMATIYGTDDVLLFGGYMGATNDETWIYNLGKNNWTMKIPKNKPSGRSSHAMTTVDGEDKVVLFGGSTDSGVNSETWVYDFSKNNWAKQTTSVSPTARHSHGLATIWGTDKVLLFGGYSHPNYFNDTWVYDLSNNTWTKKSPQNRPPATKARALASIWGTDKIILVEKSNDNMTTWEYDYSNDNWTIKLTSDQININSANAMVTVHKTDKLLYFGGASAQGENETWIYDLSGNNWTKQLPLNKPVARIGHGMASVYGTDNVVLYSGAYCDEVTWVYDVSNNTWTNYTQMDMPWRRFYHAMAPIYNTDKILLYGGNFINQLDDTWTYDLSDNNWIKKMPNKNPPSMYAHAMAPIYGTDKVLLFGGSYYLNETWVYDLSANTWTKQSLSIYPEGRVWSKMASIYGTDKVLLFGGVNWMGSGEFNDTWVFDLSNATWTKMNPLSSPNKTYSHGLASIYGDDKVVLFGGYNNGIESNETWVYDLSNNTWVKQNPVNKPKGRAGHEMESIYGTDKVMVFGGSDGWKGLNDTWIYDLSNNSWIKQDPVTKPKEELSPVMSFVYGTDRIVLLGSNNLVTWIYDFSDNIWIKKSPLSCPKGSESYEMASIYGTDIVVTFGGYEAETWTYNYTANHWTQKTPQTMPPARSGYSLATVCGTNKTLFFGGHIPNVGKTNETWEYDFSKDSWTNRNPINKPSARERQVMASIWGDDKVLLFGGQNSNYYTDTWIYDLSNNSWTKKAPANNPPNSYRQAMASIYNKDKIILFDGDKSTTWIYDVSDNNWTKKNPLGSIPSGTGDYKMATIYGTDKVLLYFGGQYNNSYGATWIYDLSKNRWKRQLLNYNPGQRYGHAMASVYGTDNVVLFGGGNDDTWIFSLSSYKYINGDYISVEHDTFTKSAFKKLSWVAQNTINTSITFQLRTATTKVGLNSKSFVGPNGAINTYYSTSPSNIWSGHNYDRWVQYIAYFKSSNINQSPILKSINLTYNNLPITKLFNPGNGSKISNNTPKFTWNFTDLDSSAQTAFQVLIDDDINFTNIDYDSKIQNSKNQSWQFPVGTNYSKLPDGSWYWKARTKDNDGDWGEYSSPWQLKIYTGSPTSTISEPKNNLFYNSLARINGTAQSNKNGSIIKKVELTIQRLSDNRYWNGTNWNTSECWLLASGTASWSYNTSSINWPSGIKYKVQSRAIDNLNNIEFPRAGVIFTIDMDNSTSGISTPKNNSTLTVLNTITGYASDTGGSGVKLVRIEIKRLSDYKYWAGNTWGTTINWLSVSGTNSWSYDSTSINWSNNTKYNIRSRAVDKANNIEVPGAGNTFTIKFNNQTNQSKNNVLMMINDGVKYTNSTVVKLTLNVIDFSFGPFEMGFKVDNGTWSSWEPFESNKIFNLPPGDGDKNVHIRIKNYYNDIIIGNDTIILDTVSPYSISIIINEGSLVTNSTEVNLKLTAKDKTSGVAKMAFSIDGKTWTSWEPFVNEILFTFPPFDGEKTVYFKVIDKAGNIAEPVSAVIILNTTSSDIEPEMAKTPPSYGLYLIVILTMIVIIVIILILLAVIFRNKRQRMEMKPSANIDNIVRNLKHEVFHEESQESSKVDITELKDKLEDIHKSGEISKDTYNYIKTIINNEKPK